MTNPEVTDKLREEVSEHRSTAAHPRHFSFKETQEMPYLQAVIKEALRLHPAVGQPLERVVPAGGTTIAGQFFPGGVSHKEQPIGVNGRANTCH